MRLTIPLVVFAVFVIATMGWQTWDGAQKDRLAREIERVEIETRRLQRAVPTADTLTASDYYFAAIRAADVSDVSMLVRVVTAYRGATVSATEVPAAIEERAERLLRRNAEALNVIDKGAAVPDIGRWPADEGVRALARWHNVAALMSLRTLDHLRERRHDAAAAALSSMVQFTRVARLTESVFYAAGQKSQATTTIAADAGLLLGRARVPEPTLIDMDGRLAGITADDELKRHVVGQAQYTARQIAEVAGGGGLLTVVRPLIVDSAADIVRAGGDAIAKTELPWPERIRAMDDLEPPQGMGWGPLRGVRGPPFVAIYRRLAESVATSLAVTRATRVAIAIELHDRGRGALPRTLEDLPLSLRDVAVDPFTGRPLHYQPTADGYVVYSVGRNGRDDGGTVMNDAPFSASPQQDAPDVGVKVVGARRASAARD